MFDFPAAPDLASAYQTTEQVTPSSNRAESTTDYIRAATDIIGGVDDVVRAFKGMPRRQQFSMTLNGQNPLMPNAFSVPGITEGDTPYLYKPIPEAAEEDSQAVPLAAEPFTSAVEAAPEPVLDENDDPEVVVFDEETNKPLRFPKSFLESHDYRIITEGGSVKGYIRPDGSRVMYAN